MKRILALLMAVFMLTALCACGDSLEPTDNNYNEQYGGDYQGSTSSEKIKTDKISGVGAYSEGLIFIATYKDNVLTDNEWYCVDKNGYIVHKLSDEVTGSLLGDISEFRNGYAFVYVKSEGYSVVDKNWSITKPSDVGATDFYALSSLLDEGYIIAIKEESSYSSTVKSMGVLNTDFEWVVPLSTSIYDKIGVDLIENKSTGNTYVKNGCIYYCPKYDDSDKCMNLETGEVKSGNYSSNAPSEAWGFYRHDGYYVQSAGDFKEFVDVEDNAEMGAAFKDGVSALLYLNEESDKYYAAMIDEKGNHLFEPLEVDAPNNEAKITVDGDYMAYLSGYTLVTIDRNGNKNSVRLPSDTIGLSTTLNFNDGIITVRVRTSDGYWAGCYDTDLNMLFG